MTGLRWIAARDGVAHASHGREPRALCGVTAIPDRYAWPTVSQCPRCMAIAGKEAPAVRH